MTEKELVGSESGAYKIGRYMAFVKFVKIIPPDFIFHEDCYLGVSKVNKTFHPVRRVKREIANAVGPCIILAHFITGGREECEQYFIFGMLMFDFFNQRASLLEFAQRCGVNPHHAVAGLDMLGQMVLDVALAFIKFLGFLVVKSGNAHSESVECDAGGI